jgi:DNA-binding XRE family transcriptional regulator
MELSKIKGIMKLRGVKSMKMQKNNIAYNLTTLRQLNKFSQEEVAERIGVSRQAVAKWETGDSLR